MNKWVFINDGFIKEDEAALKFTDLAIMRGYGIFDFLKVNHGIPVYLDDHLDRFYNSASKMHLDVPLFKDELKEIIFLMISKNQQTHCGIRITLTGGYSADGYHPAQPNLILSTHSFHLPMAEEISKGIKLISWPFQRQLPEVKTIDYLMAIWLQPLLKEKKADDVIYHNNEFLTECPRANFFMVKDRKVITPAGNILKGITRKKILEVSKQQFKVEERDIHISELQTADEIFICSTTKMILPVRQVNDIVLPAERPVSIELLQRISQIQPASGLSVSPVS